MASHVLQAKDGLLWVWPDQDESRYVESSMVPIQDFPELQDPAWLGSAGGFAFQVAPQGMHATNLPVCLHGIKAEVLSKGHFCRCCCSWALVGQRTQCQAIQKCRNPSEVTFQIACEADA